MMEEFVEYFTKKQLETLKKLKIHSIEQLVTYFPRAYLDLNTQCKLSSVYRNDLVLVMAKLLDMPKLICKGKQKYIKANFAICDASGAIQEKFSALWFNTMYILKNLIEVGEIFLLHGRVQNKYGTLTLVNPTFEKKSENKHLKGYIPIYPLKTGITQANIRNLIQKGLKIVQISSYIPAKLQVKWQLISLEDAYRMIHLPNNLREKEIASERIALEEYFMLLTAFQVIKGNKDLQRNFQYNCTKEALQEFIAQFPFQFTEAQKKAVQEIYDNLMGKKRMNRLLQGDVGSGKTAVALCGIFIAAQSGYQVAMLSPTEVLAQQNYLLLKKYFSAFSVAYLAGACTKKEKKEMKEKLQMGEISIVCGTHAILQKDVIFQNFAFCVCDEQHRFGVAQRNSLSEKGNGADMLVISATPIPRTLSLILYGDLDITTMHEKPKDREQISTVIVPTYKYNDMLHYIAKKIKEGEQIYFICPKIEEDEDGTIMSVQELYAELKIALPHVQFALLHGKIKEDEKLEIMQNFKEGKIDALVATTVIEVGIDIPNATHMIIYNAERFGLSQLHQLRGRVGRGHKKSYCFLLCGSKNEEAIARLSILKNNADGFKIAEEDLAMRGSGDFLGTKQSGKILSEIKNLKYSSNVIFKAKEIVEEAFQLSNHENFKEYAIKKYEKLKDIILN